MKPSPKTATKRSGTRRALHWERAFRAHVLRDRKDKEYGRIELRGTPALYVWKTAKISGRETTLPAAKAAVEEAVRRGLWQPDLFDARPVRSAYSPVGPKMPDAPADLLERVLLAGGECARTSGPGPVRFSFDALSVFAREIAASGHASSVGLAALLAEAADLLRPHGRDTSELLMRIDAAISPYPLRLVALPAVLPATAHIDVRASDIAPSTLSGDLRHAISRAA